MLYHLDKGKENIMSKQETMNLLKLLSDDKFNKFFSFILGIGIICMIRPMCKGDECSVKKAPEEKDFDQYVYRLGEKCYEFKSEIIACPSSGVIEAFQTTQGFASRQSPIPQAQQAQNKKQ